MAAICERCGGHDGFIETGAFAGSLHEIDYCAKCGINLCSRCMAEGCCGEVPAVSGWAVDSPKEDTSP